MIKNDTLRQILMFCSLGAMLTVNALANIIPINGVTTGDVSDDIEFLFVPASYVFSIWGVIYAGLLAYAIYQGLLSQKPNPRLRAIGVPFLINGIVNSAWIFAWHYRLYALSLTLMILILVTLILIYWRLEIGRTAVSRGELWCVRVPFSIYTGWITVATIANVSSTSVVNGWTGAPLSPELWTAIMLVIGTVVTAMIITRHHDLAYAMVIIWAFVGIIVKHSDIPLIAGTAGLMVAVVVGLLVLQFPKRPVLRPATSLN